MKVNRLMLVLFFFVFCSLYSISQEPAPPSLDQLPKLPTIPSPPELPQAGKLPQLPPGGPSFGQRPPLPPGLSIPMPPVIFIRGREFDQNKIFVESATVNKEIKVEFVIFDRDQKEKISSKAYGLPTGATYNVEVSETAKSSASSIFTWTPQDKNVGVHGIAFEASNSKGDVNRIAIFYEVK